MCFMATKNITLKIDEEVYRKARILAAQRETSVSGLVRHYLENLEARDSETEAEKQQQRRALFDKLWAISDSKPRVEAPATMASRDSFYEEVAEERGLRR